MNIVVTGAARGIGKAIAEKFAAEENQLFICARNINSLQETTEQIKNKFPDAVVHFFVADLSNKQEAKAFADWCLQSGTPDVLVNNAGSFVPGNVLDEDDSALDMMMHNNLYSAYYVTKAIAPSMKKNGCGHIFNICSIAGLQAYENGGSYSISKFALNGFSQNLRQELKSHNVKVTAIFPGAVFTDSWVGFDNSNHRIMEAKDIAEMVFSCTKLSAAAVPEEIILRPQLGDL